MINHSSTASTKGAVYPGTFDPVTLGHCDLIVRASNLFDHLIIAVASHSRKTTLFPLADRVDMIEHEVNRMKLKNCIVISFEGLLVDFVKKSGSVAIIRGIRAVSDFEYEFKMSYMNHKLNPNIETVLLPATDSGHFISSSFVKEVAELGANLDSFVSKYIIEKLSNIYAKKRAIESE